MNAHTGELYGTVVAGLASLGTGYIIPSKEIFLDIRRKASAGKIELLTQKNNILLHLPSLNSPFVQAISAEDRVSLETVANTGADKSRNPVSVGQIDFIARYMEVAAMIYTTFASSKVESAVMAAPKREHTSKARKRTKTGCLSKPMFWVYESCKC